MSEPTFWRIWKDAGGSEPRGIVDQNDDFVCEINEANTNATKNAPLLAAAPEMLEALEKIASLGLHFSFSCASGGEFNPDCHKCIANAAILKATGGAQ